MTSIRRLAGHVIIPAVVIHDASRAADLAHAFAAGGIHCAEITLRTPSALAAITAMTAVAGFTVGVGTVVSHDQLDRALDAGAEFVVTPGLDESIVESALSRDVGILPGIATPTEAMAAMRAGLDTVKFFPADRLGGLDTIRAIAAPLMHLAFVPSGGVTAASAARYLADPSVPAVSGSWMAPSDLISAGDFDEIVRRTAESVRGIGAP